jgi:3-dehydroquinate synthetase
LLEHMEIDKKAHGGKIKFVCCTGIGQTRFEWLSPRDIALALEAGA